MKYITIHLTLFFTICTVLVFGQERVGINTTNPQRNLEMRGFTTQFMRIQSNSTFGNESGIELLRGTALGNARDWKLVNYTLGLRFATSTDDFASASTKMIVTDDGDVGIGSLVPAARLHIDGGESASNTNDGYLILGPKTGSNLVFDNNGFIARTDGSPSQLFLQHAGGTSFLGFSGQTNVYVSDGNVVAGASPEVGLLNIRADDDFQLHLSNSGAGANKWNIGASNQNWVAGDDQLVFTPTNSSADAPLKLMDVGDNDGTDAPVIIQSSGNQTMLLDGNEIDATEGPLYLNHNSENSTIINPAGGRIGIGTTNPQTYVHIKTNDIALALQRESTVWTLAPAASGDIILANAAYGAVSLISWNGGGSWVALSDSTRKHNVRPLSNAMDKINALTPSQYKFISGKEDIGVIAQDLQKVVPEAVFQDQDQYGVTYDQLTALAIKGIQEQQEDIDHLIKLSDKLKSN